MQGKVKVMRKVHTPGSGLNTQGLHGTCLNVFPSLCHQEKGKQEKG